MKWQIRFQYGWWYAWIETVASQRRFFESPGYTASRYAFEYVRDWMSRNAGHEPELIEAIYGPDL